MARRSAVGIAAGAVVGPSRSRAWLRRRVPWNNLEAVAIDADGRTAVAAGDGGAPLAHAEKVGTEQQTSKGLLRRLADGDINFVSVLQSCKDTVVGAAMNEAIAALPSLGLPEFQPMQAQAARFVGLWAGVTVRA
jgi:hypothetical protein